MSNLFQQLTCADRHRRTLITQLLNEGTDCYRLFHGVSEGRPGLSVDRYGSLILVQVASRLPLEPPELDILKSYFPSLPMVIAGREGARLELQWESVPGLWSSRFQPRELGLEFALQLSRAHRDPQLFLDFRAAKRRLRGQLRGWGQAVSVLNLFAYTCSLSCHAAAAGAEEILSVDFSAGNLQWGQRNFRRNALSARAEFLECDCIAALWALTGHQRALSRHKASARPKLAPRQFSVVVVDPPAFSKGKFATVDLVKDPETVFGPAWDAVAPGGLLVAANNSARVKREEFESRLRRLVEKRSGEKELEIQWVAPDIDFPSFDGEPPLKVAFCRKRPAL